MNKSTIRKYKFSCVLRKRRILSLPWLHLRCSACNTNSSLSRLSANSHSRKFTPSGKALRYLRQHPVHAKTHIRLRWNLAAMRSTIYLARTSSVFIRNAHSQLAALWLSRLYIFKKKLKLFTQSRHLVLIKIKPHRSIKRFHACITL